MPVSSEVQIQTKRTFLVETSSQNCPPLDALVDKGPDTPPVSPLPGSRKRDAATRTPSLHLTSQSFTASARALSLCAPSPVVVVLSIKLCAAIRYTLPPFLRCSVPCSFRPRRVSALSAFSATCQSLFPATNHPRLPLSRFSLLHSFFPSFLPYHFLFFSAIFSPSHPPSLLSLFHLHPLSSPLSTWFRNPREPLCALLHLEEQAPYISFCYYHSASYLTICLAHLVPVF